MADNVVQVVIRAKDEASAEINKLQGSLKGVAAGLTAVVGAATAVSVSLFKIAESAAKNGEEMLALSQKIGLSVEATSRLKYAAEQSETSIETMRVGLRFLAKNAAEAADELAAVGIKGTNTRELLLSAAEAFSKMADGPQKAALAIKVFGRAGTELLPLLNQGASGIEALEQKADALRITMSGAAAAMGDEFNDSVATVKAQVDGLKTRIASALLPTLTVYTEQISAIIAKTSEWTEAHQPLIRAVFSVSTAIAAVGVPLATAVAGMLALKAAAVALGVTLAGPVAAAIIAASAGLAFLAVKAQEAREKLREPITVQVDFAFQGGQSAAAAKAVLERELAVLVRDKAEIQAKLAASRTFAGYNTPETVRLSQELERLDGRIEATQNALGQVSDLSRRYASAQSEAADATGKTTKAVDEQAEAWKKLNEALKFSVELENLAPLTTKAIPRAPMSVDSELPENLSPDEMTTGFQEWAAAVGLTSKAVEELNDLLSESGPLVAGLAAGFEAFAQQGAIAFDMTANAADVVFRSMMDLVDGAGEAFGKFFEGLFEGKSVIDSLGDAFIALGNLVAGIVKQIITQLAAAIVQALVFKAILSSVSGPLGFIGPVIGFARGGTVKMAEGGTVGTAPAPTSPAAVLSPIFRPIARLAMGGSVPRTVEAAAAYPPLARGASGFTVPGAIQAFDKVPALLSPGEVVLPTVAGKSPADLLGELAGLARLLKGEQAQPSQPRPVAPNIINIQAFDLDALRGMLRHGDLAREQVRAIDLGRA